MRHAGQAALTVLALVLAAGCSASSSAAPAGTSPRAGRPAAEKACGTVYTAAHVPVTVEVPPAAVGCATALRVQADYTRKVTAGEAPGNGGGGPVPVDGWTCEGYPTPEVLRTGLASVCRRGGVQFYAVLPAPATAATP